MTRKELFMQECAKHLETRRIKNFDERYSTELKITFTAGIGEATVTLFFKGTTSEVSAQVENINNNFDANLWHLGNAKIKILNHYIYCVDKKK